MRQWTIPLALEIRDGENLEAKVSDESLGKRGSGAYIGLYDAMMKGRLQKLFKN